MRSITYGSISSSGSVAKNQLPCLTYSLGFLLQRGASTLPRFSHSSSMRSIQYGTQPLSPVRPPADAALEKAEPEPREALGDAAVNQAGELDEGLDRPADRDLH